VWNALGGGQTEGKEASSWITAEERKIPVRKPSKRVFGEKEAGEKRKKESLAFGSYLAGGKGRARNREGGKKNGGLRGV